MKRSNLYVARISDEAFMERRKGAYAVVTCMNWILLLSLSTEAVDVRTETYRQSVHESNVDSGTN